MTTIHDDIRSRTEAFVAEIAALIRQAALEAASAALGAKTAPAVKVAPAKAAKAAPTKKGAPAKAVPAKKSTPVWSKAAPAKKAAPPKRAPGAKRAPEEMAALVEKLANYIKSNPGQGAEAIGKSLGLPTSEMALPIKKLLAAKRIRSEGQKRATRYFPA